MKTLQKKFLNWTSAVLQHIGDFSAFIRPAFDLDNQPSQPQTKMLGELVIFMSTKIATIWAASIAFVCAYHPAASGLNPKHTIYAFSIGIIEIVMRKE